MAARVPTPCTISKVHSVLRGAGQDDDSTSTAGIVVCEMTTVDSETVVSCTSKNQLQCTTSTSSVSVSSALYCETFHTRDPDGVVE